MKRFSVSQIYHWILSKYIKPYLPQNKIVRLDPADTCNGFNKFKINTDKIKFAELFCDEKDFGLAADYEKQLENVIKPILCDTVNYNLSQIWDYKNNDAEMLNSIQRFSLFSEFLYKNRVNDDLRVKLILSWINKYRKPQKLLAWNSFNCTVRILNWLKILSHLDKNTSIDDKEWYKIENSVYIQTRHIVNNIEYHIPGNHVVIQFFVLWLVPLFFREWKGNDKFQRIFKEKLSDEIIVEFFENGFHFEQSFHYHIQITLLGLYWIKLTEMVNEKIPLDAKEKIKKASFVVEPFLKGDATPPMLGDNCHNFFNLSLNHDIVNLRRIRKQLWNDVVKIDSLADIENQYVVVNNDNSKLIFDVGNIGLYCNPGHGHADINSVYYSYKGIPVFIDPGTRAYRNAKKDLLLKATLSHNTLSIAGENQAKLWGFFRWAFLPNTNGYSIDNKAGDDVSLTNQFYGYKHLGGYTHTRSLEVINNGFSIMDDVRGKGKKDIALSFICNPGINVEVDDKVVKFKHNSFTLKMEIKYDNSFDIAVDDFHVYPNYNTPIKSKRIKINFNLVEFPFNSVVKVIEV